MQEVDMHVNQDSYYSISVVSRTKDISYIITELNNHKQYWFFNGIVKILPNGYLLNFQLDIYATYTLTYFENLANNNIPVKLNRSHLFTNSALSFVDNLLDLLPKTYSGYVDNENTVSAITYPSDKEVQYDLGLFTKIKFTFSGDNDVIGLSANYYYVFKDIDDGSIRCFPMLYKPNPNVAFSLNRLDWIGNQNYRIYNIYKYLEKLRQVNGNKFMGCYILPNYFNLADEFIGVFTFTNIDLGDGSQNYSFAYLKMPISFSSNTNGFKISDLKAIPVNNQVQTWNYKDRPHQLCLNYFEFKLMGQPFNANYFYNATNNTLETDSFDFCFTQSAFMKLFGSHTDLCDVPENIIALPADQPVAIDNYLNYVNANKNQRDNQLNIYKQEFQRSLVGQSFNFLMSGVDNVYSTAGSVLGALGGKKPNKLGAISAGVGGLINSVQGSFDFGMGLANTIIGYNNKLNTMKAQYADAKNTMGDTIQAGNISDSINGSYGCNAQHSNTVVIRNKVLTEDTIKQMNNIIYLYGQNCPQINTLNNFTVRNDFNYYLFDRDYLTTIFSNYVDPIIPLETYGFIINQLTEGIRIWNTQPNY